MQTTGVVFCDGWWHILAALPEGASGSPVFTPKGVLLGLAFRVADNGTTLIVDVHLRLKQLLATVYRSDFEERAQDIDTANVIIGGERGAEQAAGARRIASDFDDQASAAAALTPDVPAPSGYGCSHLHCI